MDKDIGRNLQRARYQRGLNQVQLAQALNIDRSVVSRMEQGLRPVTAAELVRLAQILDVDIKFFLQPTPTAAPPRPSIRLLMRAGPVNADDELQLQWFLSVYERLAATATWAPPAVRRRSKRLPPGQAGELAARRIRMMVGLGRSEPARPLSGIASKLGLMVASARFPSRSRVAGCLVAEPGRCAAVLINSNHPTTRQRYTLAHEMGHYVLDAEASAHACDTGTLRPGPQPKAELRADIFASAFLLPKIAVDRLAREGSVAMDDIAMLETTYGVSLGATLSRLRGLRVISDTEARVLRKVGPRPPDGRASATPPFRLIGRSTAQLLARAEPDDFGFDDHDCNVVSDDEVVP